MGVPLLLFAGDLRTPRKNLDTVLAALAAGAGARGAGRGRQRRGSPIRSAPRELGLADRVHFLGHVADDARADAQVVTRWCFPSRYGADGPRGCWKPWPAAWPC